MLRAEVCLSIVGSSEEMKYIRVARVVRFGFVVLTNVERVLLHATRRTV